MNTVNKYSSFGGPGGIKAVPGLYVDYERGPLESIYICILAARVEERRNSARDRIIALRDAEVGVRQPSTNGRGHAINKPRN